jgi:hypothetical protein
MVEALCYKPRGLSLGEVIEFFFSIIHDSSSRTVALWFTEPITEMSTRSRKIMFLGCRARPVCVRLSTLLPSVSRFSRQCGILNISQPYRPPRPVRGTGLPFIGSRSTIAQCYRLSVSRMRPLRHADSRSTCTHCLVTLLSKKVVQYLETWPHAETPKKKKGIKPLRRYQFLLLRSFHTSGAEKSASCLVGPVSIPDQVTWYV